MKLLILLIFLAGCSSHENYRLIELTSLTSPSVTVLEIWDSPYGWEYDGLIIERHIFSGSSLLGQIATPSAIAYAASEIGNETNVTTNVKGETNVTNTTNSTSGPANHNHGHGDDGL